ncbi:trehalose operon repressor [Alkalicoccus daliensis]|uniref:Trehalose operon repressor n=1 Tax=Alkalicoccus daliensis TaxID=745820 RepID=A0A1H0DP29_9BACI|nr:trehalose operon repressor [Alkalicoccus daliensis]SDN71930.1 GntR family transcriptional regulator, trehalose operon transcriptional repressor [Alkalicoccus daliensis]
MQNKYLLIYREIADKIQAGTFKAGEKLPSEHELVQTYSTSRETIRKALNQLAQNGYIQKVQGKGSIVLDTQKFDFPVSGLVSFKELADNLGESHKTYVEKLALIEPDDFLQTQLHALPQEGIWEVHRVREIENERIILDKDFFKQMYVEKLTEEICRNSIYDYIENELHMMISFAKKEITVGEPTDEDRKYLDLEGFSNIVVVKNYVYFDDASLFQYTESRHRPDRFKFVDFARRSSV